MSLEDKVCLVTGASRGIGAAIARDLAGRGACVALHYARRGDLAEALAERLPGEGHATFGRDLEDADAAPILVDDVVAALGGLDVLINNAGVYVEHPPLTTDRDDWQAEWRRTLAINLLAPAHLCHAAARVMAQAGGGRIVNVGSRGAFRGEPDCPAYGASKAGLHAMGQSLAQALAPQGVLVFAVAPGFVETDMAGELLAAPGGEAIRAQSPFGRVAAPEEVAATVGFLASEAPAFLSGGIVDVNGASYLRG